MRRRSGRWAIVVLATLALFAIQAPVAAQEPVELTEDAENLIDELALLIDGWIPALAEHEHHDPELTDAELAELEEESERLRKLYKRARKAFRQSIGKGDDPDARLPPVPLEFARAEEFLDAVDEVLLREYLRRLSDANVRASTLVADAEGRGPDDPLTADQQEALRVQGEAVRRGVKAVRKVRERQSLAAEAFDTPIDQPLPTDPGAVEDSPATVRGRELALEVERILLGYAPAETPEEPRDAPQPLPLLKAWKLYGSARFRVVKPRSDSVEVSDQSSRIGATWRRDITRSGSWTAAARAEFGLSFIDTFDRILEYGDGTQGETFDDDLLFLRLAFLAVESRFGRVSFGKQWSAYYDVALFTDQLPALGGLGTSTYNAGTDGGVSGTGRADNALQYRLAVGRLNASLQMQIRNITDNNRPIADTYGASFRWKFPSRFDIGIGYNKVMDGVPDPDIGQPKIDDQSTILGVRYDDDKLYAALTYSRFVNHEFDDFGRFYSGDGVEVYADYDIGKGVKLRFDISALTPDSNHPGEFREHALTVGASWKFREKFLFYPLLRIDRGLNSDGSPGGNDEFILGVNYTF